MTIFSIGDDFHEAAIFSRDKPWQNVRSIYLAIGRTVSRQFPSGGRRPEGMVGTRAAVGGARRSDWAGQCGMNECLCGAAVDLTRRPTRTGHAVVGRSILRRGFLKATPS